MIGPAKTLLGVLTPGQLLPQMQLAPEWAQCPVAQVMQTEPLLQVAGTASGWEIAQLLQAEDRQVVGVVPHPESAPFLVGMVTCADVLRAYLAGTLATQGASALTWEPWLSVTPETPLATLLARMRQGRARQGGVIDRTGRWIGLITWRHLVQRSELWQQHQPVTVRSPVAITAPTQLPVSRDRPLSVSASAPQPPLAILETILDRVLAGYWIWDIATDRTFLSPGFKQMFGYADHELPNQTETWQVLMHREDLPQVLAAFRAHIEHRRPGICRNEVRYRHRAGHLVWVICVGQIIEWDATGQATRMIGCHVDITERKQAETQLQQTQAELERFFSVTLDLLCIADCQGRFRRLNRAWEALLGYAVTDLEGRSFLEFVHPDDQEQTRAAMAHLSDQQQTVQSFINRYRRRDGTYRDIEWFARPYGQLIYAAARDITERKRTEERLRQQDAHLRAAQRIAQLGSWEFTPHTGAIVWSEQTFAIFGRDPALGAPSYAEIQRFYHPDDRAYHDQQVTTAIATGQPFDLDCRICRPDGRVIYIQARGEPILDATGQVRQLIGTILDVTERKQTELQLRHVAEQLTAANQELEAFAYSVSHDLRAPLRAIDGFSQALFEDYRECFKQGEGRDYCQRIHTNVQRMGTLIDDLLRLSRVSRSTMRLSAVDLSQLVRELAAEWSAAQPERSVEWAIADTAIAHADRNLMRIALENLLSNAWKFTRHHPTARIEFGMIPQSNPPVYFLRDDGAGFEMTYADQLFGVFQRLHSPLEFPGTGIGLATVQRIIHRHGGRVWAEGEIEQGAIVYFTLLAAATHATPSIS